MKKRLLFLFITLSIIAILANGCREPASGGGGSGNEPDEPGEGQGIVNVHITMRDQGQEIDVSGSADAIIYKYIEPRAVKYTLNNPVSDHIYIWYINNEEAHRSNELEIYASDYSLGYYTVRITVQINNSYWSIPGNLSFTVMAGN
ncbi:MAG: hypothetical protein FWD26_00755 [Treponema sp.]|nr:hypothetical protein [Treponema sp.]